MSLSVTFTKRLKCGRDWRAVGHNAERRKWVRRDAVARWLVLPAGQPTPALRVRSAEGDEEKICGDDEKRKSATSVTKSH